MKMSYCVLGTNNMEAAISFYDALFDQSDFQRLPSTDRMTYWQDGEAAFAVALPFDGEQATNGNGSMVGFNVGSQDEVKRLHKKVLDLGGTCEGKPGPRGPMFSAYARDLDQNKLCFFA